MPYILALDQGTTSSRAIVFDHDGAIRARGAEGIHAALSARRLGRARSAARSGPRRSASPSRRSAARRCGPSDLAAIGITNQRETTIVWDRDTGEPIHNAIVWQDRRTADFCERLKADGAGEMIQRRPGCSSTPIFRRARSAGFSTTCRARGARRGRQAGVRHRRLLADLEAHRHARAHVTDVSNASRTMLFNIHTLQWDDELLRLFDVPASMLPEVRPSSDDLRRTSRRRSASSSVPIAGIAGDQQAALFGQMCRQPGMSKNTYGTGCFLLQNIGTDADAVDASSSSRPSRGRSAAAPSTHSRAACSSAARWCSGCATASA